MSRRVLVLEPSVTIQSVFSEIAKDTDIAFAFDTNGLRFLVTVYNTLPDAVLINARNMNPACLELVRLIKSIARFKQIPVGVYSTSAFLFNEEFRATSGADLFILFNQETLMADVESLIAKKTEPLAVPVKSDVVKASVTEKVLAMISCLESIPKIASSFLSLLAELGELPAAALFVEAGDNPEGFYIASENFGESQMRDFLNVCMKDYETHFRNQNMALCEPQRLEAQLSLEAYNSEDFPLSAYQVFPLVGKDGNTFGTVHMVRSGAFSVKQTDVLSHAVQTVSALMETATLVQRKIKFERNIRRAFSRFVPEQIVDELVDDENRQKKMDVGEKRDVAILFCDIRSFTNISECNKPEAIVAFLNRYFTIMCTAIKKHGGTVDKFIGDAIMALFGAPVSYEDNARRAVAAAYEMRALLASVPLEDLLMPDGMKFEVGIGVHYGDVIVGSIGSDDKTNYSVIGDNVNLASRIEGLTKVYGAKILVSGAVKDCIKEDSFIFRYLDDVKVKGKAHAVSIYAVDSAEDDFPQEYRDAYNKGFALYRKGVWNLAREYFQKALEAVPGDKAAKLMLSRSDEFIANPPEQWDGAITFMTK